MNQSDKSTEKALALPEEGEIQKSIDNLNSFNPKLPLLRYRYYRLLKECFFVVIKIIKMLEQQSAESIRPHGQSIIKFRKKCQTAIEEKFEVTNFTTRTIRIVVFQILAHLFNFYPPEERFYILSTLTLFLFSFGYNSVSQEVLEESKKLLKEGLKAIDSQLKQLALPELEPNVEAFEFIVEQIEALRVQVEEVIMAAKTSPHSVKAYVYSHCQVEGAPVPALKKPIDTIGGKTETLENTLLAGEIRESLSEFINLFLQGQPTQAVQVLDELTKSLEQKVEESIQVFLSPASDGDPYR